MAVFVDPKTGERFGNVPDEEAERAQSEFGLISPEEYDKQQRWAALSPAEKAADYATAVPQAIARGAMAPGMALQQAITGKPVTSEAATPEVQARYASPGAQFEEGVFSPEAIERKERHPFIASTGEALPSTLAGGALGGAVAGGSLGLLPGAGLMAGESALQGVSQEAVESVTGKRDFSASSALMNGGIDLAFSTLTFGLAHGFGKLGKGAARATGEAAGEVAGAAETAAQALPPKRNFLSELDPGEAPQAIGGARRARSAGAAASVNQPYAARAERAAAEGAEAAPGAYKGRGVNDVEPLTDDVYDAAVKDFDDATDVKRVEREARFLADPKTAQHLTDLGAMNVADNLDSVRTVLRDDASLAAKNADFERMATEWTPEQQAAKKAWMERNLTKAADDLAEHIQQTRAAAKDAGAGRAGPRAGGADAIEAGGFDAAVQKTLRTGMDKIRRAEGAQQAIAIDSLKRELGGTVNDIRRSRTLDAATKAERTGKLVEFYTTLQQGLESEDLFGKMGSLQKATNEATTRLIEPFSRIEAKFSERLGDTWGKTGQAAANRETKASAVASMLRASPVEQREFIRVLDDGLSAADDLIAARQAHGITHLDDLEAAKKGLEEIRNEFRFARVLKAAERRAGEATTGLGQMAAEAAVDFAGKRIPFVGGMAASQGKGFLRNLANAAEMPKPGTPLGDVVAGRLKAYAKNPDLRDAGFSRTLPKTLQEALRGHGGQVAGVAGLLGGAAVLGASGTAGAAELLPEQQKARQGFDAQLSVMPPDQQARAIGTAESFARIQRKTEQRVEGAVTDLFALAKDPSAEPRYRSPEARVIDQRAQKLDVPRHMARFMGDRDDPVQAFRDKSKLITKLVSDPAALARNMADNLGELPREQPEIFASMVGQTMMVAQYLHDKMPGNSGRSALDPGGYPPTFEEISEWAGHWTGAIHPLDSLDDLASNDLVPEQMEAVQALHPEGYAMFQTSAMKQIHSLSRKRGAIPLEALEQIDGALGLDGAGEPILSSAMAGLIQQATAKEAERLEQQAQAQKPQAPMVSQSPSRLASSSLSSLHPE